MLDHVSITVSDMHAAERFYDAIMKTLDVVKVGRRDDWLGYGERARPDYPDRVYLTIRKGVRPEGAIGRHWCFKAKWRKQVDAFWGAGIAAGGTNDGAPGLRDYHASYYAAFLRDPDGNRIEAVCHHPVGFSQLSPISLPSGARLGSRIVTCVPLPGSLLRRRLPPRRSVTTL